MRLTDLLGCRVETEGGERLGYVFDVRVARRGRSSGRKLSGGTWWIDGLLVGSRGLIERLGIRQGGQAGLTRDREVLPWSSVMRLEEGRIVVRERAGQ